MVWHMALACCSAHDSQRPFSVKTSIQLRLYDNSSLRHSSVKWWSPDQRT